MIQRRNSAKPPMTIPAIAPAAMRVPRPVDWALAAERAVRSTKARERAVEVGGRGIVIVMGESCLNVLNL